MDDNTRDLIRRLCLRAGAIMEDASLLALTMPANETGAAAAGLAQLDQDTQASARLVAAAVVLSTRAHQHAGRLDQGDPVRIDRVVTHEGADEPPIASAYKTPPSSRVVERDGAGRCDEDRATAGLLGLRAVAGAADEASELRLVVSCPVDGERGNRFSPPWPA